jgi:hypothetical protein
MMRLLILIYLMLYCLQPTAQTYSFNDDLAQDLIQHRQDWDDQINQLLMNASQDRVWNCVASNYDCVSKAIAGSRRMHNALSVVVDEWMPLFNQTNRMLTLFKQLELPEKAELTREQYQTYYFLLNQSMTQQPDLIAYTIGKLGHYSKYKTHYKVNQMLAMDALGKKQKLDKIRRLALLQISEEKKLLSSL